VVQFVPEFERHAIEDGGLRGIWVLRAALLTSFVGKDGLPFIGANENAIRQRVKSSDEHSVEPRQSLNFELQLLEVVHVESESEKREKDREKEPSVSALRKRNKLIEKKER
jgi:hypothetical protein